MEMINEALRYRKGLKPLYADWKICFSYPAKLMVIKPGNASNKVLKPIQIHKELRNAISPL